MDERLIHGFAGLVSLADWIGSNAEDERFFCYDFAAQDEARWEPALQRAREVLRWMRIDVEDARADLRQRDPAFDEVFGFAAKEMQRRAADVDLPSPVILEAETGSGKTEAALWRFKTLFEQGEVDSLCFLLPTRVAATSIYARVSSFIERCFPDPSLRPTVVLGVPGYLRANGEDGHWLARFQALWGDGQQDTALFWAAENSKRYFAATAVAGTIDQFLLSALQTGHSHLRGAVSLRALVVADEVHSSDHYMRALLKVALKRHVGAGGHALLLSATLATDARADLLHCAANSAHQGVGTPEDAGTSEVDYPCISAPGRAPWIGHADAIKRVEVTLEPAMRDAETVANHVVRALDAGARVLVLRNTVRQAVATQRAIEAVIGMGSQALFRCADVPAPHHGRFALPDRQLLDMEVERRFGKPAAEDRRACVLCATQTLEISVDCDADYLITDLAPMDVLLQRIGRLHRHARRHAFRADAFRTARVMVLVPAERDLELLMGGAKARGLGIGALSAYPDLLCLEATWRALERAAEAGGLRLPEQNRALVEESCNLQRLSELADARGAAWQRLRNDLHGKGIAARTHALYVTRDWDKPWDESCPGELAPEGRTRLGLDGIDLELPEVWTESPFGQSIQRVTVPAWMLSRLDEWKGTPEMHVQDMGAGLLRFAVGEVHFAYDRLGLSRITQ